MVNFYITATRKRGENESEITHYRYNTTKSYGGEVLSKEDLWNLVMNNYRAHKYYSFNPNISIIECEWKQYGNGQPFLQSFPDSTEDNNLLSLEDC